MTGKRRGRKTRGTGGIRQKVTVAEQRRMKERETESERERERSINSARNGENGEGRKSSVGEGYGLPLVASQAHKDQPGSSGNEMDWL
jgi:hypothetical protein